MPSEPAPYAPVLVSSIQGGLATSDDKIKQQPAKIAKIMRAALKGAAFYLAKRDAAIKYSMEILKLKDRDMAAAIYDEEAKLMVRNGISDAKILQPMIDEMKAATKTQRDMKLTDVFDFSFARKANEELKASGWKP